MTHEPSLPADLHGLSILLRGVSALDLQSLLERYHIQDAVARDVAGHAALLAVRPGESLSEAALELEEELLPLLGGECWFLLCDQCARPLQLGTDSYWCPEHGATVSRTDPSERPGALVIQQRRFRPGRHRARSAHKKIAVGEAWARFIEESSHASAQTRVGLPEQERHDVEEAGRTLQLLLLNAHPE